MHAHSTHASGHRAEAKTPTHTDMHTHLTHGHVKANTRLHAHAHAHTRTRARACRASMQGCTSKLTLTTHNPQMGQAALGVGLLGCCCITEDFDFGIDSALAIGAAVAGCTPTSGRHPKFIIAHSSLPVGHSSLPVGHSSLPVGMWTHNLYKHVHANTQTHHISARHISYTDNMHAHPHMCTHAHTHAQTHPPTSRTHTSSRDARHMHTSV